MGLSARISMREMETCNRLKTIEESKSPMIDRYKITKYTQAAFPYSIPDYDRGLSGGGC